MRKSVVTAFFMSVGAAAGCGQSTPDASDLELRDLTRAEALSDFREIVTAVKTFYGPLEYKEQRFGIKIDELAAETERELAQAGSDPEFFGAFDRFLMKFQDGHVSISYPDNSTGVQRWMVPVFIAPFEGKAVVTEILDPSVGNTGIEKGDILVSIDGTPTFDFLPVIKKYETVGFDVTDEHWIFRALMRPFYMTELTPKTPTTILVVEKADGSRRTVELAWRARTYARAKITWPGSPKAGFKSPLVEEIQSLTPRNTIYEMGNVAPFFATQQVQTEYNLEPVILEEEFLNRFGLSPLDDRATPVFAARYTYGGKRILLVRQHDYYPGDWSLQMTYVQKYKAILAQHEAETDVLVVDQTHNGGGSYCSEFYAIFAKGEENAPVQFMNADRRWITEINAWAEQVDPLLASEEARQILAMAREIETAYDAGKSITDRPQNLFGGKKLYPPKDFHWTKPMLVLADELAGSCADIFPMLVRDNKRAKIFGRRTMGLGGNVEEVAKLSNSNAGVRLTRGLYTTNRDDGIYTDGVLMENNGVAPDFEHKLTIADFRAGYVGYFKAFSDKALAEAAAQ